MQQIEAASEHAENAHLVQLLSSMMIQINALQVLLRNDLAAAGSTSEASLSSTESIRNGLVVLEQMTREILFELRPEYDEQPLSELVGVSLTEALSRVVEETAESIGLSSRTTVTGEEHALSSSIESLLYRIAREALYQVQQRTGTHRIRFLFNYGRDEVQMNIEDDGVEPGRLETVSHSDDTITAPPFLSDPASESTGGFSSNFSILRHRLEHLGGSLEISASIEQGTRVQARVPYTQKMDVALTPQLITPAKNVDTALRIRLLIVDSLAVTRAGLRSLLESYPDLEIIGEAADGLQAVSETLELGPQVVLLDTQLPGEQSIEALRQIKQLNPDTKVLLLSALDREEYLYQLLRAGANGLLLKDIAPVDLAQAIRTVVRGETLVQPQLASRLLTQIGKHGSSPNETLTAREQEVLQLLARGLRNKEIASRLFVSERTVNFHLANIYQKLNVSGRTEALSRAIEQGLIRA